MYDVAIIGSGPAGISAAINVKILGKSYIWFSSRASSKKVERAELIQNYIGLPDVTGGELAQSFKNHYESMGLELNEKLVSGVYGTEGHFTLLAGNENYLARSVILCTGVQTEKPLDGEEEFLGRGVSYCATCDGFLYKDKTIAVLITDKKLEHEAEYLCNLSKKAYVMPMYKGYEINSEKAEIILKNPVGVSGGMKAEKVRFKDGEISVDGLFILRGSVSPATLVHGLRIKDGHILVNRDLSTNIKGLFAAGDCTGRPYQYAKSVGEGNVAAHSAAEYLATLK